ncbi:PREDICTED: uncharacterized protein LOC105565552, partial [Vollenhovia emeryi]|uniref:uncharacterized protein LOC105565552 n=1 Tax=Vollenhovia emeryi TaxID=411798 RepID=UPI0005F544AC
MVVMFMDLKAAFDSVNREILVENMRKRGVNEGLIERCEEILRETECKTWTRYWREKDGGGVKVGGRKVWTLAYADDVAVVAESEGGMTRMIERLEEYMEEKGLEVNVEKTKIVRCRKGGGRWKK